MFIFNSKLNCFYIRNGYKVTTKSKIEVFLAGQPEWFAIAFSGKYIYIYISLEFLLCANVIFKPEVQSSDLMGIGSALIILE